MAYYIFHLVIKILKLFKRYLTKYWNFDFSNSIKEMARLFVQNLDIYNNSKTKNLAKSRRTVLPQITYTIH